MNYKVVIPSAGLGSRIGPYSKFLNKALVTIGDKPAIAKVIEKFPIEIEIIILIGYKGEMIKDALSIIFPERKLKFIKVDKYQGLGSGLGYTLAKAKKYLQCPFIFIPNDTIIGEDNINLDPNLHGNWIGYYVNKNRNYNSEHFRCIELSQDRNFVSSISGKGTLNENIYCGICGVQDFKSFWKGMNDKKSIESGEVNGLRFIRNLKAFQIHEWYDCGTLNYLEKAKEKFNNFEHNILEKEDETIWFVKDNVIKFCTKEDFISDRVNRLKFLPKDLFPKIIKHNKYCYTYKKVPGQVVSEILNPSMLLELLDECSNKLWSKNMPINKTIIKSCYNFYREKTYLRLEHFLKRFEQIDKPRVINGLQVDSVKNLLDSLNWAEICEKPNWSLFHGDLHNENIIYSKKKGFTLLDWRQNFAQKSLKYGDAYYDLAKIKHGLLVNHGLVKRKFFKISELNSNEVNISILQLSNLIECNQELDNWIKKNSYDLKKVNIITALIYINISGLHDHPYSNFLYIYGQNLLAKFLN